MSSAGDNLPVRWNGSSEASAWPSTYRRLALSETTRTHRSRSAAGWHAQKYKQAKIDFDRVGRMQ
jgi:hypothetical protein